MPGRGAEAKGRRGRDAPFAIRLDVEAVRELPPPALAGGAAQGGRDEVRVEVRWTNAGGVGLPTPWRAKKQVTHPVACEQSTSTEPPPAAGLRAAESAAPLAARTNRTARINAVLERTAWLPDDAPSTSDAFHRPFVAELRVRRRGIGRRRGAWEACGAPATVDVAALARQCSPVAAVSASSPGPISAPHISNDSGTITRRLALPLGGGLYRIVLDVTVYVARKARGAAPRAGNGAVFVRAPPKGGQSAAAISCLGGLWGTKPREAVPLFANNPLGDVPADADGSPAAAPEYAASPAPAAALAPAAAEESGDSGEEALHSHPCADPDEEAEEPLPKRVEAISPPRAGSNGVLHTLGGMCKREVNISPPPSHSLLLAPDGATAAAATPAEIENDDSGGNADAEDADIARALALSEESQVDDAKRRDAARRDEMEQVRSAQAISSGATAADTETAQVASEPREGGPASTGNTPLRVSQAALAQSLLARPERLADGWIRLVLPDRARTLVVPPASAPGAEDKDSPQPAAEASKGDGAPLSSPSEWRWVVEARLGGLDQTSPAVGGSGACACIAVAVAEAYASHGIARGVREEDVDLAEPGGMGVPHTKEQLDAVVVAGSRRWRGACQLNAMKAQHAQHGFHLDLQSALDARRELASAAVASEAGLALDDDAAAALSEMAKAPELPAAEGDAEAASNKGPTSELELPGDSPHAPSDPPLELPPGYVLHDDPARSFVGFLTPPAGSPLSDFLAGAPGVQSVFRDAAAACAAAPRGACFVVGWNDHWFTVFFSRGGKTAYLVDTLGSRLFEGCSRSYCLRFPTRSEEDDNNPESMSDAAFWKNDAGDAVGARALCAYLEQHASRTVLAEVARAADDKDASLEPNLRRLQVELHILAAEMATEAPR